MRLPALLALAVLPLLVIGCSRQGVDRGDNAAESAPRGKQDKTSQPLATKNFRVSAFDKIAVRGPDDVVMTTNYGGDIVARGPQSLLDDLMIGVVDGELRISRTGRQPLWSSATAPVVISVPAADLTGVSVQGSGDLRIDAPVHGTIALSVSGSGDAEALHIDADAVNAEASGSGDVRLGGKTKTATLSILGSGNIPSPNLAAHDAEVTVDGSGGVVVGADGTAKIRISGSGDVTIKGPARCAIDALGSGEAHCG